MGTWGAGLYSNDMALDLRSTVRAVARLPLAGSELLQVLRAHWSCADDPLDEEQTTFWLVVADQFYKRSIVCSEVTQRATDIIRSGSNLATLRDLGFGSKELEGRAKRLDELAAQLADPPLSKNRKTLSKPQSLLLPAESVWAFPTMQQQCYNAYCADPAEFGFVPDGWSALVVLSNGLAFDWLAWYAIAVVDVHSAARPTLGDVIAAKWRLNPRALNMPVVGGTGSLSSVRKKRLGLEEIGRVDLVRDKLPDYLLAGGTSAAVHDRCICNSMGEIVGMKRSAAPAGIGPAVRDWLASST